MELLHYIGEREKRYYEKPFSKGAFDIDRTGIFQALWLSGQTMKRKENISKKPIDFSRKS